VLPVKETQLLTLVDENTGTVVSHGVTLDVMTLGTGPTVLLLHGVEGAAANRRFAELLAEDHRVIAPSHPGFDLSPRPDWCDSVDDLAYLYLDWLDRLDAPEVVLVGLQFGGWLAAEIAVRSCSRLSHVVLVDPVGIKVGGREDRDIADVFAMSRTELDALVFASPEHGPGDLTRAPEEEVLRIARNEEALALYGWEPYLHNPRLRRWLHRISAPSLVVWGEHDGIVSPAYGKAYADPMPRSSFELVASAGHRPQLEQPDRLAALIRDFTSR
jgi:pimeloyl-ACP methyl ester carboxylesterase